MHAEFPLTRVWQPDGPCAPSDSGLNQALCFLWHGANHRFDAVSGRVVSTDNTTYAGSEKGKAPQCAVSQVNIEWANYQPCVTSNGAGSGDFAMSILANPAASGGGANEHGLAQKNDAAGGDFAQAVILFHGNSSGAYTSGSACFYTFQGAVTAVAAASVCDGRWHLWTGVRSGTNLYLYKDGILIASGSGTLRNISQANRYVAIGSRGNGTTGSYRNQAALAAMWNRAPSATEVAELAGNPWQLFEPESIEVYWAPAGGGGSAESGAASTAGAGNSTATGAALSATNVSATGTATATAAAEAISASTLSAVGAGTATLAGDTAGGAQAGDVSAAGSATATASAESIASAVMSSAGAATVIAVGAAAAAAITTRHEGRIPRAVLERERKRKEDEDIVAIVMALDQEWRMAA